MLTLKEFDRLVAFKDANKKISATQLMEYIEGELVNKAPIQNAFKRAAKSDFLGKARPDGIDATDPFNVNETRKAEKKKGYKIRTKGESERGDNR